jgi:peptidoglycan-associated lipoprotein
MNALKNSFLALAAVAMMAGCASKVPLNDKPPVESRTGTNVDPNAAGGADAGRTSQSQVGSVDLGKNGNADSKANRVVYFDYDSYVVKDEYRPIIDMHAKTLSADRKKRMMIEGHTDDRGGREYNLALGQKRAEAVLKSLVLLGATDSQLEAVSYGKERPAVQGNDEAAFAKNRRAELNPK